MSELDTELAALRADLHETINPPDLGHVTGLARQRTTRRRMQIGAVAAVVAASVAVPVLRALPDGRSPALPSLPASMTFQLDFADPDHGFALGSDCAEPDGPCTLALFATADGGRSWERRTLPDGGGRFEFGQVTVHDANRLTIDRAGTEDELVTRIGSEDAGRTWQRTTPGPPLAPAPMPRNAWTQSVCVGEDDEAPAGCRIGVGSVSPDLGRSAPAPSQPPLIEPVTGRVATAGGHFWAAGVARTTGRWALSVSGDGGTTWSTTPVTFPGEPEMSDAWAVVETGGVLYATVQGSIAKGPFGLLAVFRSTDGGVTWTNTWRATAKTVLQAMLGSPIATADGRLLVYTTTTGTHESRDGRTFTGARQQVPGPVQWTRGGYVAERGPHAYSVSRDGTTWRDFEIG